MQNIYTYNWNEAIALIMSVLIGTAAYIGFVVGIKKQQKVSVVFIFSVLFINLFITYVFSEALKVFKWGEYRSLTLPLVAYAGLYLMEWVDKRYLKIFDAGAKKIGLNLENDTEENLTETPTDYEENNEQNTHNNEGNIS